MFQVVWLFLVLCFRLNICLSSDDAPQVDTPLGKASGLWKTSLNGRKYASFEGIPYAKPPVGDLRFEEPEPVLPWIGTWEADTPHSCPQTNLMNPSDPNVRGSEDCLYLNVAVPAELIIGDSTKKLDVIVSIHGGAFIVGSGHTMANSDMFMDRDVVFVSINYRLGLLGFLSTEDDAIPGNNGLKDQSLALKWVRDNIASFGGNPQSVTIIGLSAGGASVHFHYLSPLSKGLFHKGVSQSGTAVAPWAISAKPLVRARRLAALLGCPDKSTNELKACLKQRPLQNLLEQTRQFYGYGMVPLTPFAPVVEKNSGNPFLDRDPYKLLEEGEVADVPWITSITADDGLLPAAIYYDDLEQVDELWTQVSVYLLDCNYTLPLSRRETVSREVLDFYLGAGERINKKNFKRFTQIFTDRFFALPAEVAAKTQSKATKSPVYYYYFNYKDGENKAVDMYSPSKGVEGVGHGEDAVYFYGSLAMKPLSDQDKRLREVALDILYTFATTGKPSFHGSDAWKPTGPSELTYLNITGPEDIKLQTVEQLTPIEFWGNLKFLKEDNVIKDELYNNDPLPEVNTPLGKVQGLWKTSLNGRKYGSFEGIPYAKPPVGDLRFEEPQPVLPWLGTWEAKTSQTCAQPNYISPSETKEIKGTEDCLYLNVAVPAEFTGNNAKKLDVIVSIHGGGFIVGSGHTMTNSDVIMDRDVVLVTINYRLGILGFLSTEDDVLPGNNGMKDQVLALKWVRDNIASFGGNPQSVTIVGLSAGGVSVHLHYLSPLSKGLFTRGLSQSGTALNPWVIKAHPSEHTKRLASLIGCPDKCSKQLKACLKQRPVQNFLDYTKLLYGYDMAPITPFGPVIEKASGNPFLDQDPYSLLAQGKVVDAPWITSNAADDGLLPSAFYYEKLDEIDELWPKISVHLLDCNYTLPQSKRETVSREILEYYLGAGQRINKENYKKFTRMLTDRLFAVPAELAARMQAKATKSPVYHYYFNYKDGENKAVNIFTASQEVEGVCHAEDATYFYGTFTMKPLSDQDKRLRERCLDILYSFATTGHPSFDGTDAWKPTGASELTYLNITGPENMMLKVVENLTPIDFWSKLKFLRDEDVTKDEL